MSTKTAPGVGEEPSAPGSFHYPHQSGVDLIVSFDPGGTTGVAFCALITNGVFQHNLHQHITSFQMGPGRHHSELESYLNTTHPDVIVYEGFQYRQFHGTPKAKVDLIPVEYIGIIKLFEQHNPSVNLHLQTASKAKGFVTDDKLKALDLYKPGMPHANDAVRHLLYYIVVDRKIRQPITTLWKEHTPS